MSGPHVPKIVVGLRGSGRTHALIEWLCHGTRKGGWPGWSRLLVVADPQTAVRLLRDFPDLQTTLHQLNTGGLGRLAVSVDALEHVRGFNPDTEIAVDDAEHLLGHRGLRMMPRPSVIAITGQAVTPAGLNGHVTVPVEQLGGTYIPSLATQVAADAEAARSDYEQRKFDHDILHGRLPVTDPIRCLAQVGPDVGEQHCGQRGSWLRGRPGILPGTGHPTHGWVGHESGWKAVRCPGGDIYNEPVRIR